VRAPLKFFGIKDDACHVAKVCEVTPPNSKVIGVDMLNFKPTLNPLWKNLWLKLNKAHMYTKIRKFHWPCPYGSGWSTQRFISYKQHNIHYISTLMLSFQLQV